MTKRPHNIALAAVGTAGEDLIRPGVGTDWNLPNAVDAGAGNDSVMGGKFADTIMGGDGDDYLDGMGSADLLTGGAGADIFKMHSWAYGGDTITDFESGTDKIDLANYSLFDSGLGDTRDLTFADLSYAAGVLTVPSGYAETTWDDNITLLGAPILTESDFIF
jgi:Ca2+-binding RTX toxin-like protein